MAKDEMKIGKGIEIQDKPKSIRTEKIGLKATAGTDKNSSTLGLIENDEKENHEFLFETISVTLQKDGSMKLIDADGFDIVLSSKTCAVIADYRKKACEIGRAYGV